MGGCTGSKAAKGTSLGLGVAGTIAGFIPGGEIAKGALEAGKVVAEGAELVAEHFEQ